MSEQELDCLTAPVRQHRDDGVRAAALNALPALVCEGDERVILFLLRILSEQSLMWVYCTFMRGVVIWV